MRYTLTLTEALMRAVRDATLALPGREGAAFLRCGISSTREEVRLLGRAVSPVASAYYLAREPDRMSIASDAYAAAAKEARGNAEAIIFVHSHPDGYASFSKQDDLEDPKLMRFFGSRVPDVPHGCLVLTQADTLEGRVWFDEAWQPIECIRILGSRFRLKRRMDGSDSPPPVIFERHAQAFGPDIQHALKSLHIGVVGAGGTGSPVIELLARLGVGTLSVFDGDVLSASNVTRVHGSSLADAGAPKVEVQASHVRQIGLGTVLHAFPHHLDTQEVCRQLRTCDIVFGCTDKQAPRALLVRLALWYLIPVIDVGVKIDALDRHIASIAGRVTTVMPGEACLFCRRRIDPRTIRAEGLPAHQRDRELEEGYIPALQTNEPAVVMFTTAVACQAVSELLQRLTGFIGTTRESSEVLMLFHEGRIRTNRQSPAADCLCTQQENWGRGDTRDFLGRMW